MFGISKKLQLTSILGLFVVLAISSSVASAQTKIIFNVFIPRGHPIFRGMIQPWANDVKAATNGRVVVEFPAASMAPPPRQWSMVTSGIADAAMLFNTFERKRLTLPPIAELPLMTPSAQASSVALWRTYNKHFKKAGEFKGVKLLSLFTTPGNQIHHGKFPINKIDDMKNTKMLAYAGIGKEIFTKLGTVVVAVPAVKSHEIVSKGIVDGVAMSIDAIAAFKLIPYMKHTTVVPGAVYNSQFSFFMNERKWNGLSSADKSAISSVSGERIAQNAKAWDAARAGAQKALVKGGIKIQQASDSMVANLRTRLGYLVQDWVTAANKKGVDGPAAFKYFQAQLKTVK